MPKIGSGVSKYVDKRNGRKLWKYSRTFIDLRGDKQRIRAKGFATADEAKAALDRELDRILHPERAEERAQKADKLTGANAEPTMGTLIDLMTKGGTFKGKTIEPYDSGSPTGNSDRARMLEHDVRPFFGHMTPSQIDQQTFNEYKNKMRKQPGKYEGELAADRTVLNKLFAVTGVLTWATETEQIIPRTPWSLKVEIVSTKARRISGEQDVLPLEQREVDELLACCEEGDHRYRVAILLAADCGLRIGEILGARWTDIKNEMLTIHRQITPKGIECLPKWQMTREVPLSKRTLKELEKLRKQNKKLGHDSIGYVIQHSKTDKRSLNNKRTKKRQHMSYGGIHKAIKAIYKRAHIFFGKREDGFIVSPWHSLRHTFGTQLVADNMNAEHMMRLMGHTTYETTRRYIKVTSEQLKRATRKAIG